MAIIVGIDVGTQSTKTLWYDTTSRKTLALTQKAYGLTERPDGTREQDASWWIEAIIACFSQVDPAIREQVEAIGVSGQQHGFVPVDAAGEVIRPVKLWNDTSTAAECGELNHALGGMDDLLSREGNPILPGYTASKILWLKKHEQQSYDRLDMILLPHDYVNFFLTGEYSMEYGDASGTALMDIRSRTWSERILAAVDSERDLRKMLPPLREASEPAGHVCSRAAGLLGIPRGVLVSSGGGDNMMGAIGTGTVADGPLTMSLGTSGTVFGCYSHPVIDSKGRLAAFCSSSGAWLPLLCTMNCTVATERVRELFGKDVKSFDALAMEAPVGSGGLVMLPYFNGERTPNYPHGKGCLMGFTSENMTEAHISRAAMESAVFGLKYGLDAFKELGFPITEIRLIGGGAKSGPWRHMVADVCDVPVVVPQVTEAAAFGAVLQAYWAWGTEKGEPEELTDIITEHVVLDGNSACMPNASVVPLYQEAYVRYLSYVGNVAPLFS
ncbi:xylulokinase [Parasphaerochaeta coccoides]|uniref:Xylulose kinase n=1 Tax=Parasphaerochaeta coccoides (strain ATCC BAA-1237 / DSM 17374 / SPN1) TaxID=760011 RepID=F4GJW8_PARC1|nr:xylulokinase [Parasphaerochaeta coccoides]AEC01393.1 xylulokinase [Parasphaerochaeta coccoides DSM 17374]